ncbi:hypothetical protein AS156_36965 [Bradyrhizobium macuxiense]|uniref:Uncharacterized protein n=1 Tax=Bradyrhizobium macuxiense TaxID=1755647 RepID=A0A109JZ41_9BRAD|nr:hypothetical protein AS156_36965 [Bradyrhizobium macuxiense]
MPAFDPMDARTVRLISAAVRTDTTCVGGRTFNPDVLMHCNQKPGSIITIARWPNFRLTRERINNVIDYNLAEPNCPSKTNLQVEK